MVEGEVWETLNYRVALCPGQAERPAVVFILTCRKWESEIASFAIVLFGTFFLGRFLAAICLLWHIESFHLFVKICKLTLSSAKKIV